MSKDLNSTKAASASHIRVRFAPAPTGLMHLGNVRAALMNFLFARQQKGVFVLRIEDTDAERNFDPQGIIIREDLSWLGISYDEGPGIEGPYGPYLQSMRSAIYEEKRKFLEEQGAIYRCFCSSETLEQKRHLQQALKMPPRYDRSCLKLSTGQIDDLLSQKTPFIWRFKLDQEQTVQFADIGKGAMSFELKNFSDFPIARQDGSVMFIFANFVDDMTMHISHVFRGEDHLSNTANQIALYKIFQAPIPIFWHMPILCNLEGKKLSKRDFGFSLRDLKAEGFAPEAILNYLATIGTSFGEEIMNTKTLIENVSFEQQSAASHAKYDPDKLRWINRKWLERYSLAELASACRIFLEQKYPAAKNLDDGTLASLLGFIRQDMVTFKDSTTMLDFYFAPTRPDRDALRTHIEPQWRQSIFSLVSRSLPKLESNSHAFLAAVKEDVKKEGMPLKQLFGFLRLALTNSLSGPNLPDLLGILGNEESRDRINVALEMLL